MSLLIYFYTKSDLIEVKDILPTLLSSRSDLFQSGFEVFTPSSVTDLDIEIAGGFDFRPNTRIVVALLDKAFSARIGEMANSFKNMFGKDKTLALFQNESLIK